MPSNQPDAQDALIGQYPAYDLDSKLIKNKVISTGVLASTAVRTNMLVASHSVAQG